MSKQDFQSQHRNQRRVIVIVVICFIATLALAIGIAWQWVPTGAAQSVAQPIAATPIVAPQGDPLGRIDEISRSQDRFVQTILGIIALMGTGFALLVGLNLIQSNRNFERESSYMRSHVETETQKAVTEAQAKLREIVNAGVTEAKASVDKAVGSGKVQISDQGKEAV